MEDEDGDLIILGDIAGTRRLPPPITRYSAIQGEVEEGYAYLETAMDLSPAWAAIPTKEPLEVGSAPLYSSVKVLKDTELLLLPDATKEKVDAGNIFRLKPDEMYAAMTAKNGWGWFDRIRSEERFAVLVQRPRAMMDNAVK